MNELIAKKYDKKTLFKPTLSRKIHFDDLNEAWERDQGKKLDKKN